MNTMIQKINSDTYFQIQKKLHHIPYSQSKGWFKYKEAEKIVFFTDSVEDPNVMFYGIEKQIPLLGGKILLVESECLKNGIGEKTFRNFYSEIVKTEYKGIEINSNNTYNVDYEIALRRAGFKRPLAIFNCPLTIEIDLNKEFNFDNNWKRNVKKATKAELIYKELKTITETDTADIVKMFAEMAKLKSLSFTLNSPQLRKLINSEDIRVFMVYDRSAKPLAARIIHINNKYATDIFAANSNEARRNGTTYFMMDRILKQLKEEDYKLFDFGRIPPSNNKSDSVYVYKNASRGNKIQYNGDWVFYKNKTTELLMFIYKTFWMKKRRY